MLDNLLHDSEAVIRQHIAGQLLHLAVVAMVVFEDGKKLQDYLDHPEYPKTYDEEGYELVCHTVVSYLSELITDPEVDVRRAASDSLAGLALQLLPEDVPNFCLPIPLQLAMEKPDHPVGKKRTEAEQRMEELRTTACNLLAELGGAASEQEELRLQSQDWVRGEVLPAILELCSDDSFRVRRSAAQALPRVLGACTLKDAAEQILPTFERLSQDDIHRVRKSTGECLVDMSRALMILATGEDDEGRQQLHELRQKVLLPIADRLIQDSHKQVRQGMMQFLGPFMASFYPYQYSALHRLLPASVESDGSHHMGIVAQFFPHASSMVARLNSSQNAIAATPTPVHSSLDAFIQKKLTDADRLQKALPPFIHAARMSTLSLAAVTSDRKSNPPEPSDLAALADVLLDYFAALSVVSTGDENTDAEMRVYCAYSFPALVLLLGPENWEGSMRTCFFTLLNPSFGQEDAGDEVVEPPLPVKRCLASSLHTVAHILGPELAARDVIPAVQEYFLPDSDDSVRLNMIRNFGALLYILPPDKRKDPFLVWSEIVQGDSFLGGRKRSVTNPLVLNWRQRNYLARSLPDIIGLVGPSLLKDHVWPILQILLTDSINDVRDDALWSVAPLLKAYCGETVQSWNDDKIPDAKKFSTDSCNEVVDWIVNNILISPQGVRARPPNFTDRQVYCRICGSVGLALRLSEEDLDAGRKDAVSVLSEKIKSFFFSGENQPPEENGPYQALTAAEQKHLKRLLLTELLPPALEMKEDRTSNVRITLMKVLQILPFDVRTTPEVKPVLKGLEEESETWFSFGGDEVPTSQADEEREPADNTNLTSDGPVDVDNVTITPASSRDEDDDSGASSDPQAQVEESEVVSSVQSLMTGDGLRSVLFEDGPIGMQLEPTREDKACRIYGFNDFGPGQLSPAQASGKVEIGDVIVSVNGVEVKSYDETIDLLKAGGQREVVLRTGTEDERYMSDDHMDMVSTDEEFGDSDEEKKKEKKAKKEAKKSKKSKKKSKGDDATVSDEDGGDSDGEKSTKSTRSTKSKKKAKRSKSETRLEAMIEEEEAPEPGDASVDSDEEKSSKSKKKSKKSKSDEAVVPEKSKSKKAAKVEDAVGSEDEPDSDGESKKAKKEAKKAKDAKKAKKAKKEAKKKK